MTNLRTYRLGCTLRCGLYLIIATIVMPEGANRAAKILDMNCFLVSVTIVLDILNAVFQFSSIMFAICFTIIFDTGIALVILVYWSVTISLNRVSRFVRISSPRMSVATDLSRLEDRNSFNVYWCLSKSPFLYELHRNTCACTSDDIRSQNFCCLRYHEFSLLQAIVLTLQSRFFTA